MKWKKLWVFDNGKRSALGVMNALLADLRRERA